MTKYEAMVEQVARILETYSHDLAGAWRSAFPGRRVDLAFAFAAGFVKDHEDEDVHPVAMEVINAAYTLQDVWRNEMARQAAVS